LTFNFLGLLVASVVFNLPFMVQPIQRAFEAIPPRSSRPPRSAGWAAGPRCGAWSHRWPGILAAAVLTFVHTQREFGVVLMMGGSIPGQTKTIAISIYDRVQTFDLASTDRMALLLLLLSLLAVAASFFATARLMRPRA